MIAVSRNRQLEGAREELRDVCIIGGGVNGAAVFRELSDAGYRTLLVERGDFCARTSQASGLLIWGGLLYLRNLEFRTVQRLCSERDRLLARDPDAVRAMVFRYLPLRGTARKRWFVSLALELYWLLGGRRRARPRGEAQFESRGLLAERRFEDSLRYEEAGVVDSDCRFVTSWITTRLDVQRQALNYCSLEGARWNARARYWELELEDQISGLRSSARARVLINAAGVWVDPLNELCGLKSPYRHVLSKGVYLNLPRPATLDETLVFETELNGDNMTFTPWGPVALWGPTEGVVEDVERGYAPDTADLRFLLQQAANNLRPRPRAEDVVSLRCGIRPLAVKRAYRSGRYPLSISRRHLVARDRQRPALMIYGGKLTSAHMLAREVLEELRGYELARPERPGAVVPRRVTPLKSFGGLELPQPDAFWCRDHEACLTLEDYLRRRSNIAQWVPRLGLGAGNRHRDELAELAQVFHGTTGAAAALRRLEQRADRQDQLLASV